MLHSDWQMDAKICRCDNQILTAYCSRVGITVCPHQTATHRTSWPLDRGWPSLIWTHKRKSLVKVKLVTVGSPPKTSSVRFTDQMCRSKLIKKGQKRQHLPSSWKFSRGACRSPCSRHRRALLVPWYSSWPSHLWKCRHRRFGRLPCCLPCPSDCWCSRRYFSGRAE